MTDLKRDSSTEPETAQEPPLVESRDFDLYDWIIRYETFNLSALDDQRAYYKATKERNQNAARQVNQIRATLALFTGVASGLAALFVQIFFVTGNNGQATCDRQYGEICLTLQALIMFLAVLSIVLPAIAALFNSLADLYQWDRTQSIYQTAAQTIEYAAALAPQQYENDAERYRNSLIAYAEATLALMSDEQAQWGQAIRTPKQLDEWVESQLNRAGQSKKP